MTTDPVGHFFGNDESRLLVQPTLDALEAQAANADSTRTVASNVIESLRGSDVMRMAATKELGGVESSILAMGRELEAVADNRTKPCLFLNKGFNTPRNGLPRPSLLLKGMLVQCTTRTTPHRPTPRSIPAASKVRRHAMRLARHHRARRTAGALRICVLRRAASGMPT